MFLAVLVVTPTPTIGQPIRPVYRTFGDWLLACDNTAVCLARQVPDPDRERDDGEDGDTGLEISRDAGPGGAIEVRVSSERRLDATRFHAENNAPMAGLPWRSGEDDGDATLSGEPARRFVRGIVDAPALMLAREGAEHLSLRGLGAALLAMDEAQGRIGNTTALIRPGAAPASAVPAAVDPPHIAVAPPPPPLASADALAAAVRRSQARVLAAHECDRDAGSDDAAYPLTATEAIVVLGCGRFAYQSSVLAFRAPRDRPAQATLLVLPEPPVDRSADPSSAGEYVSGDYDPANRVFTEYAKGRAMADCGSSTEWTFDGRAFHLSAFAWQDRCGGNSPGDWPVLCRTQR